MADCQVVALQKCDRRVRRLAGVQVSLRANGGPGGAVVRRLSGVLARFTLDA